MLDIDVNWMIWGIFMSATMKAAVHLGQNYEENLRISRVKAFFDISQSLILNHKSVSSLLPPSFHLCVVLCLCVLCVVCYCCVVCVLCVVLCVRVLVVLCVHPSFHRTAFRHLHPPALFPPSPWEPLHFLGSGPLPLGPTHSRFYFYFFWVWALPSSFFIFLIFVHFSLFSIFCFKKYFLSTFFFFL